MLPLNFWAKAGAKHAFRIPCDRQAEIVTEVLSNEPDRSQMAANVAEANCVDIFLQNVLISLALSCFCVQYFRTNSCFYAGIAVGFFVAEKLHQIQSIAEATLCGSPLLLP